MDASYDLIIIGAGIAGLAIAANLPADAQLKVLFLEARSRIGGRAHTETIHHIPIDLGCSWIHHIDGNPLYSVAQDLKLDLFEWDLLAQSPDIPSFVDCSGKCIGQERTQHIILTCLSLFYFESCNRSREQDPLPALTASVGEWIVSQARERLGEEDMPFVDIFLRGISSASGVNAHALSLRYHGPSAIATGPDRYLGAGYRTIVEHLRLQGRQRCSLHIQLDSTVASVQDVAAERAVRVSTTSGETFKSKRVIVTVPLGVLKAQDITFSPALPQRKLQAIARMGFGVMNKLVLVYPPAEQTWWQPGAWLFGFFTPRNPLPDVVSIYAHAFVSTSAHVLLCHISADDSPAFEEQGDEELTAWGHQVLTESLARRQDAPILAPMRGFATRWRHDQYSRGTYSYIRKSTGDDSEAPSPLDFVDLANSCWSGRLGFAGEATELNHHGYAHGAFLSGKREAERIATSLEAEKRELDVAM